MVLMPLLLFILVYLTHLCSCKEEIIYSNILSRRLLMHQTGHPEKHGNESMNLPHQEEKKYITDKRGYVALVYSGTARSFSSSFESHIVNIMAGSPFTIHIFLHTFKKDYRFNVSSQFEHLSNYHSVNATLNYFKGYRNIDNEEVLFEDIVKSNVLSTRTLEDIKNSYHETFGYVHQRHASHPPIPGIYLMWYSQYHSDLARQAYMHRTGIKYKWIFRMRYDAVYLNNWWQFAFHIRPLEEADVADSAPSLSYDASEIWHSDTPLNKSTQLHDMVYTPRLALWKVYVPNARHFGGYNDQFIVMNSTVASIFFGKIQNITRMLAEKPFLVHPEASVKTAISWANSEADVLSANMCYNLIRIDPLERKSEREGLKFKCYPRSKEIESCVTNCPIATEEIKRMRTGFYVNKPSLVGVRAETQGQIAEAEAVQKERVKKLSRNISTSWGENSSSFYYFYRYLQSDSAEPCLITDKWLGSSNPYRTHNFQFVLRSTDVIVIQRYNQLLTCDNPVNV